MVKETGGDMCNSEKKLGFIGYLKTNKGGISNLVFEVVMSVIILSLLIVVIFIFRSNLDIISSSADRVNDTDKIKADLMLHTDTDKDEVTGSIVISVLRFYSSDNKVQIDITMGEVIRSYIGEDYNPLTFPINFEDKFKCSYEYEGTTIKKIKYNKI